MSQKDWDAAVAAAKLAVTTGQVVLDAATVVEIADQLDKLRAPVADERAAFEAYARRNGYPLNGHEGFYGNIRTRNQWMGWKARAALASAPVADERDRNDTISQIVGLCNRIPGATTWNAAQFMYDEMHRRAALASAPVAGEAQPEGYSNRACGRPIGYVAAHELARLNSGHDANLRSAKFGPSALDGDIPVYLEPTSAPQASAAPSRCEYCDGTGDVHSQDGEWRGVCICSAGRSFQERVQPWMMECFGPVIAADRTERNHRFVEEALELAQACGCSSNEAHQLVDYVFSRPIGEPSQEVGGVMVTLAALCLANKLNMHDAADIELARISHPAILAKIRAKNASKPKHSPLPGKYMEEQPDGTIMPVDPEDLQMKPIKGEPLSDK